MYTIARASTVYQGQANASYCHTEPLQPTTLPEQLVILVILVFISHTYQSKSASFVRRPDDNSRARNSYCLVQQTMTASKWLLRKVYMSGQIGCCKAMRLGESFHQVCLNQVGTTNKGGGGGLHGL